MVLRGRDVITLAVQGWPAFRRQITYVERIDRWSRGKQSQVEDTRSRLEVYGTDYGGDVFMPEGRGSSPEYRDLGSRAPAPWARLVIDAVVQTMFVDGIYLPGSTDPVSGWASWQRNGMDAKQISLYRAAVAHGISFVNLKPGRDRLTGESMNVWRPVSARRMAAFFEPDADDEYPSFTIEAHEQPINLNERVWFVKIEDETATHYLQCKGEGYERDDWTYISYDEHDVGVCPTVVYVNQMDLDGRTMGEVEPIIPLLRRIDQDVFDRLVMQRYGAWKVRYATGFAKPSTAEAAAMEAMRLKVEDLLINTSEKGQFGTLDATPLEGVLKALESDLRTLSAVTQTPPHHMLGLSSNMQAESLAAVEAGLQRKAFERKTTAGERHEQLVRLDAFVRGDREGARIFDAQVKWRNMESRSLSQVADAMAKLAQQVQVPPEMLWEKYLEDWTDTDTDRALKLVQDANVDALLERLEAQTAPAQQTEDEGG